MTVLPAHSPRNGVASRGIALGRRSQLFAGCDRGGVRAAARYTLITTVTLNDVNTSLLAGVLAQSADHLASRLLEIRASSLALEKDIQLSRCRLTLNRSRARWMLTEDRVPIVVTGAGGSA